jgi:hypothetical protein
MHGGTKLKFWFTVASPKGINMIRTIGRKKGRAES